MFKFRVLLLSTLLASIGLCASISETEVNGGSTNNTLATAQAIPGSAFTSPAPVGVFNVNLSAVTINGKGGGSDVDFYSFFGQGIMQFSITDNPYTFSTILSLYDGGGNLLAFSASSDPIKPGSQSTEDSYIGSILLPSAGTYYIAVGNANASIPAFPDTSSCGSFDQLTRPDNGDGGISTGGCNSTSSVVASGAQPSSGALGYTLVVAQAPEPGTFALLGFGMIGLVLYSRRNTRNTNAQEVR